MLSAKTIQTIKAVTPAVAAHAEAITNNFYERMFRENPEVRSFFNQAHQHAGSQQRALAGAIAAYFTHIENPSVLMPAIEVIAQKHCSLQIKPEHYPIVGKHLLAAVKDVFGDAANDDVLAAVGEAYQFLADVCIAREQQIFDQQRNQVGGWSGFRDFTVVQKIPESETITSFYLKPSDGGPLPTFKPGQYTTVRLNPSMAETSPRNYSLSDPPGSDHFRISVKREMSPTAPRGVVSNYLHDDVKVGDKLPLAAPSGDFYFDQHVVGDAPVVFLAGGIGVTPLLTMAKDMVGRKARNKTYFFLASPNSNACAFTQELRGLTEASANFRAMVFFDEPLPNDHKDGRCDFTGRVDRAVLTDLPCSDAHFYVCGPKAFMQSIVKDLKSLGVTSERIHFEFFGPMQDL